MEREIVVRGEGRSQALPDRATVRVTVEGDAATRGEAYDAAAVGAAAVDAVLGSHSDALRRINTAALVVQPLTRWRNGESVRTGWRASRTSVVEISDFDRLDALLANLVVAGTTTMDLAWELDVTNAAHGDARRRAAADARSRAESYAEALGLRLGEIAWVAEPGLRQGAPDGTGHALSVATHASLGVEAAEQPMAVRPEEITVYASVEVGFSIGI